MNSKVGLLAIIATAALGLIAAHGDEASDAAARTVDSVTVGQEQGERELDHGFFPGVAGAAGAAAPPAAFWAARALSRSSCFF